MRHKAHRRDKMSPGPSTTDICGTLAFATRKDARLGASRVRLPRGHRHRAVRCPRCDLWHITFIPQMVYSGLVTADEWYGRNGQPCYREILGSLIDAFRARFGVEPRFERREHHGHDLWSAGAELAGTALWARDRDDPVAAIQDLIESADRPTADLEEAA